MESSEQNDRLTLINALLIALVTLIGAFVAWRASVAADTAGDASLDGLIATLNVQETIALNNTQHFENYRAYTAYTRYNALGDAIEADLESAPAEEVDLLDRQMREAWDAAESFYFPREYLKRDGAYDKQREIGEAFAEAARQRNLNPQPSFAESDLHQKKSNWLIGVITLLALALLCFTLVESISQAGLQYAMVAVGVLLAIGGVAATIAIEYYWFV